ncbi:hypothetical protein, no similarity [Maudiozyma saulgeensis]|uniref:Uncharacterized protein n=1 Tax=Maudiozyma saulgeensis TaxID=1789683 RepID=A0A1X7R9S7_9SACH|nr:hypothetical protein, no similarity [Kazachstania saulgeensis]
MHNAIKENNQLSEANSSSDQEDLTCRIYYVENHNIRERIFQLSEITDDVLHPLLTEINGCILIMVIGGNNGVHEDLLSSYNEWLSIMGNPVEATDRFESVSFCGFTFTDISDIKKFTYHEVKNFTVIVGHTPDISFHLNEILLLESPEGSAIQVNSLRLLYLKYYSIVLIKCLMQLSYPIEDICESKELEKYEDGIEKITRILQDTWVIDFILNCFYMKSDNNYAMRHYVQERQKNVT